MATISGAAFDRDSSLDLQTASALSGGSDIPVGKTFQEGLFKQGILSTAFEVSNIEHEYQRLRNLGVVFTREPKREGPLTIAICVDTSGT